MEEKESARERERGRGRGRGRGRSYVFVCVCVRARACVSQVRTFWRGGGQPWLFVQNGRAPTQTRGPFRGVPLEAFSAQVPRGPAAAVAVARGWGEVGRTKQLTSSGS